MKLSTLILILVWIVGITYDVSLFYNFHLNNIIRDNEQILKGDQALWFRHHGLIYGCLAENQRMDCQHKWEMQIDKDIQKWIQDIEVLR